MSAELEAQIAELNRRLFAQGLQVAQLHTQLRVARQLLDDAGHLPEERSAPIDAALGIGEGVPAAELEAKVEERSQEKFDAEIVAKLESAVGERLTAEFDARVDARIDDEFKLRVEARASELHEAWLAAQVKP